MSISKTLPQHEAWDLLGRTPDREIGLLDAAMLVARDEYPELDTAHYEALWSTHTDTLRSRLTDASGSEQRLMLLNRYLFDEQGFSGNHDAFYDPRNSYINDVLDRRLGIPLSLALVQMELARRLEVPLEGISFPGHFLVRLQVEGGLLVLDPYHRGRSVDVDERKQRASPHLGNIQVDDQQLLQMLEPASHRMIVMRMLRNLKGLYLEQENWEKALRCADRLVRVAPHNPDALRDRGALYHRLGHVDAARPDLMRYLELSPDAEDNEQIRELLVDASRMHTSLN